MINCRGCQVKFLNNKHHRLCEGCDLRERGIMQECCRQHTAFKETGHLSGQDHIKLDKEDVKFLETVYLMRGFKSLRVYGHWIGQKDEE